MKNSLGFGCLIVISALLVSFNLNVSFGSEYFSGEPIAAPQASADLLSAPAGYPVVYGEVRKVDLASQKITIRHEEIPNLDMSPMTMVFKAASGEMLEAVEPGAEIRFVADSINGQMTVLWLEVQ